MNSSSHGILSGARRMHWGTSIQKTWHQGPTSYDERLLCHLASSQLVHKAQQVAQVCLQKWKIKTGRPRTTETSNCSDDEYYRNMTSFSHLWNSKQQIIYFPRWATSPSLRVCWRKLPSRRPANSPQWKWSHMLRPCVGPHQHWLQKRRITLSNHLLSTQHLQ